MNSETLRAVVDCLIPPDDFPGAYDAGVCHYLKRLFRTDLASQSGFFRAGIEGIEAEALARFNTLFADLTPEQKISILAAIESGDVKTSWSISPSRFFEMLVNTTAEGFYSDPQQGGNRHAVSWVMTGFENVSDS
ncbi:MAG TPA: gluconate 2-dehydrogenase subunit 3 family protein [Pyrinomonadaceae bacterium]|jgi:gluconate 2-dehydrogenase gamma chain|nr:gluconate 2-dehydrogenase subunit 3 family protein [Pyrinomonadaceae bacterium]